MYFRNSISLTGEKKGTQLRKLLNFIKDNGPTTKYDLLTKALDFTGTRKQLRGNYSRYMQACRANDLLCLDFKTHKYELTETAKEVLLTDGI